jgi:hypothetical protein
MTELTPWMWAVIAGALCIGMLRLISILPLPRTGIGQIKKYLGLDVDEWEE